MPFVQDIKTVIVHSQEITL